MLQFLKLFFLNLLQFLLGHFCLRLDSCCFAALLSSDLICRLGKLLRLFGAEFLDTVSLFIWLQVLEEAVVHRTYFSQALHLAFNHLLDALLNVLLYTHNNDSSQ